MHPQPEPSLSIISISCTNPHRETPQPMHHQHQPHSPSQRSARKASIISISRANLHREALARQRVTLDSASKLPELASRALDQTSPDGHQGQAREGSKSTSPSHPDFKALLALQAPGRPSQPSPCPRGSFSPSAKTDQGMPGYMDMSKRCKNQSERVSFPVQETGSNALKSGRLPTSAGQM